MKPYKFKTFKSDEDRPSTSRFWYDLTLGGYLKPKDFTTDPATLKAIEDAITLLQKLEAMCLLD